MGQLTQNVNNNTVCKPLSYNMGYFHDLTDSRINIWKQFSQGGLPTFWDGDAHQKISMEPLRCTNLGVAHVNSNPKRYHLEVCMQTTIQSI